MSANAERMRELVRKRWAEYTVPSMKVCARCGRVKPRTDFGAVKGHRYCKPYCHPCEAAYALERASNLDVRERNREIHRSYHWKHRAKRLVRMEQRRAAVWERILEMYGRACACCGETERHFLTVDHVNNDGGEERGRIGWGSTFLLWLSKQPKRDGYQILCLNCNLGRARNKGVCPHAQSMREAV